MRPGTPSPELRTVSPWSSEDSFNGLNTQSATTGEVGGQPPPPYRARSLGAVDTQAVRDRPVFRHTSDHRGWIQSTTSASRPQDVRHPRTILSNRSDPRRDVEGQHALDNRATEAEDANAEDHISEERRKQLFMDRSVGKRGEWDWLEDRRDNDPRYHPATEESHRDMVEMLERLDAQLATLLSQWSVTTTLLALVIVAVVAYPIIYPSDPDTHPLLLARQTSAAPIRNKGSSAAYRSPEVPYGTQLRSGLNVRDVGAPRWASGKDGDIRDIWREVTRGGSSGEDGKPIPTGLIMTILGRDEVVEHKVEDLTREILVIGRHLSEAGVKRVALYLPNSVEYLLTAFACAFYGMSPVLLPYNQPHVKVYELINSTGADALICAAGNLPLDDAAEACKNLKLLTWVVEKTSRHMDWNGVPDSADDHLKVSVWHDVVAEQKGTGATDLPTNDQCPPLAPIISVWQPVDPDIQPTITTFTHQNIVAATAALITTIPLRQRLTPADLILPADGFTHTYILCQTFAALFTHASLAISSVAGPGVDLATASRSISPTIIIASAETMASLHAKETAALTSMTGKLGKYTHSQAMSAGRMPTDSLVFRLLAPSSSSAGNTPGKLRLILTSERLGAKTPFLTSTMLSDLRLFTRARICYALTTAAVAGAVAQSNVFDYRTEAGDGRSPFGAPISSVEVTLTNEDERALEGVMPRGQVVVRGPGVSGGETRLVGVRGQMGGDGTLRIFDV
ncbi:hypothetical protein LTR62_008509 [Meristemomyces frigidus]|uniref:AMP-dependent synthetase/ligase domain-containing protein n=1 Tax=Meristemomyces frigidus TaxID=1508187 RepID=A0AAN7TMQ1_9PEZI|nr:hypothetical protein LTR62_008509 [Meristemomyces frigidus]